MDEITPSWNLKCIVFTLLMAGGYWYLPPKNKWVLLLLLYFPYLVMAWYDYYYQCKRQFGPTFLMHYYQWFKPPGSEQLYKWDKMSPKWKKIILLVDLVIAVSIVIIAPFFLRWKPS